MNLYRIMCKDCPWFQTFETKAQADENERHHQAEGHHTERSEFKGKPPTLRGKGRLMEAIERAK